MTNSRKIAYSAWSLDGRHFRTLARFKNQHETAVILLTVALVMEPYVQSSFAVGAVSEAGKKFIAMVIQGGVFEVEVAK